MKGNERKLGLGILVGFVLLMSMFSLRVIPTPAAAAITAEWTAAAPMNDTHAQALVVQDDAGLVYVIGGTSTLAYAAQTNVSSYNIETGQWRDLAPLPTATRGPAGAYYDGKIYVFGGYNGLGWVSDTQIYDIRTNSWSAGTSVPRGVWEGKAGAFPDGRLVLFGGESSGAPYSNQVDIYNVAGDSWSLGTTMPVGAKAGAVVSVGYSMYYIGGVTAGAVTTANVYVYYSYDAWDTLASMPRATAALAAVEGADGLIYAFGGGLGVFNVDLGSNATSVYNIWDNKWFDGPNMSMKSRYLGGAATSDGLIVALGGNSDSRIFSSVESMRIMSVTSTVSPATVATGRNVQVTMMVSFANVVPRYVNGNAELLSGTGVSYGSKSFSGTLGEGASFEIAVPQGAPAGAYKISIRSAFVGYVGSGYANLPDESLSLAVVVGETLDQQMTSLKDEIANLQAQLATNQENTTALVAQMTVLLTALSAMQTQVDDLEKKADAAKTYGMISVILVIIVIILVALIIFMARRGGA